jgi:hypothetical protein
MYYLSGMEMAMKNRYGDEYDFVVVDDNTLTIVGDLNYWRFGGKEGQHELDMSDLGMVDPSGGPYISVGSIIEGRQVKRISVDNEKILFRMGDKDED